MNRVAERSHMTPDDYLAWEREQETKHEYDNGSVYAMAGGSVRHNALGVKIGATLLAALGTRGCVALSSDQRVSLRRRRKYVYPDGSVVCGRVETEPGHPDTVTNPSIIVEVLSSSTEQYDRGGKWERYRRIPTLTDYVLVSQTKPQIEVYQRTDGGRWSYIAVETGERVTLTNGAALDVDTIFDGMMQLPGDTEPDDPDPE